VDIPPNTNIYTIEAGDDANTAYVAGRIGGARGQTVPPEEDADVPLIWRTTDGGKTWVSIVSGLPKDERTGSWVNSLRVDPQQTGLLFAGTETTVYVSFDNGDHWQPLRQNLPSTSIRDLEVHTDHHQNDLVIGTTAAASGFSTTLLRCARLPPKLRLLDLHLCISSRPKTPFVPA
jgi:hypothetical protein